MAARRLVYRVAVTDDEDRVVWFGPDDDVPAWASKQITNKSAWSDNGEDDADADAKPAPRKSTSPKE